eukprot:Tamp_15050.p1 GENE.Tamp_15050~~Tamp_15050.p1  ORF type:complete len:259 (+),score=39.36 Tamp_15050:106-777(+)
MRQVAGPVLRGIRSVLGRLVVQMAVIAAAVFAFAPMQAHAKAGAVLSEAGQSMLSSQAPTSDAAGRRVVLVASLQSAAQAHVEKLGVEAAADGSQDEWPGWSPITRTQLLEMKRAHDAHHHHAHHEGVTLAKVFMTPLTLISTAVETLKLMFPLMMITVPICYVFPWELITGGYRDSTKLFRKNSNDRPSDPETRNFALVLSTLFNAVLAFCFGAGGGGGGHH